MDFTEIKAKRARAAERKAKKDAKRASLGPKFAKKKGKRKKLPGLTKLRRECWKALSLYVRARDAERNQGLCMICSEKPITLGYHLIPAGSGSAAKWDHLNVVGACRDCNCGEFNRRVKYAYIHIQLFGLEYMTALEAKSRTLVQYKRHDFISMTADFSARLAALKGEADIPKQAI